MGVHYHSIGSRYRHRVEKAPSMRDIRDHTEKLHFSDVSQVRHIPRQIRSVASSSSNSSTSDEIDSWMSSRRTTGRSLCPSMVTARSSHLTAFRGNDAKNWRSSKMSMGSMGSIMETEG